MEKIKSNSGYKTLKADKIGEYVKIEYDLIKSNEIASSAKLVYAFLKAYENSSTNTVTVSMDEISRKSGYGKATVNKAIRNLELCQAISVRKRLSNHGGGREYNVYTLKVNGPYFAMITITFLESSLLSCKEKEFMLLVFPYLLDNDTLGAVNNPASISSLSALSGLSHKVVSDRVHSLKVKGLLTDHYTKRGTHGRSFFVGYKFDMMAIMIDAISVIKEERDEYRQIVHNKLKGGEEKWG